MARAREAEQLRNAGRDSEALAIWRDEVLPIHEQLGDLTAQVTTQLHVAATLQALNRHVEALSVVELEVLPAVERVGDPRLHARALELAEQSRGVLELDERR